MAGGGPVQLARQFFDLLAHKDYDGLSSFLHPEVVFAPRMFPDRVYTGHDEVLSGFYELVFGLPAYTPKAFRYEEVSPDAVLVDGRIYRIDERGTVRDTSAYWFLEFRDGQLITLRGKGTREEARELAASIEQR